MRLPERPDQQHDDCFLQLVGWEPFVAAPNEVSATTNNRHPTLDTTAYDFALQGGKPWYYAEVLFGSDLLDAYGNKMINGLPIGEFLNRLTNPSMLVYYFFYPLHIEPLRGCEEAGEGQTFATFAGEWTSIAILFQSDQPTHIALSSRNVGDPKSFPSEENRVGYTVHKWFDVDRVGDHPKLFVSRGTHGYYLKPGPHELVPFTPGDIDLNQGTCAQIETLDEVIPGGEEVVIPGEPGDEPSVWVIILKGLIPLGAGGVWLSYEYTFGSPDTIIPALQPNKKPLDETGGPNFGLILRPAALQLAEASFATDTKDWPTKQSAPRDRPKYDFLVDRREQVWWPPRGDSVGYAGRWGPRVTNDPKARRAGMRCPQFPLMMLEAVARL